MNDQWRIWDSNQDYGQVLFKRATGELPEMESSKSLCIQLEGLVTDETSILDIGCGSGHYLRSLRRNFGNKFRYTGVDATDGYLRLAKEAWRNDPLAEFKQGDIFQIPIANHSYDIVICCNVLLHLPEIKKPIEELVRVCKKSLLIRLLVSDKTFIVRELIEEKPLTCLQEAGFNFFNVYSKSYVQHCFTEASNGLKVNFSDDVSFNSLAIEADASVHKRGNGTKIINGTQVNGSILCPWSFVHAQIDQELN